MKLKVRVPSSAMRSLSIAAIDRVHRIGQQKTVYVTHFVVRAFPPESDVLMHL